jgi:hypothetical protein
MLFIAGSYLSATFLPYHYERALRIYLNANCQNNANFLRRVIGGIGGVLGKKGEDFVGHKPKNK